MTNFIDICINRDRVEEILTIQDTEYEMTTNNATKKTYKVKKEDKSFLLNICYKDRGLTTLFVQGTDKDFGDSICQILHDELKYFDITSINFTIPVSKEDFSIFIDKVQHQYNEGELTEKDISGGTQYVLSKAREGKLILKFYTKRPRIHFQGKATKYFSSLVDILTELDYDVLGCFLGEIQEISLKNPDDIIQEYFPLSSTKFPNKVRNITSSSLQLLKLNVNLSDYGLMVYPLLRTLEYVIREVLEKNGYELAKYEPFKNIFSKRQNKFHLTLNEKCTLGDEGRIKLEKCYNFYYTQRHDLAHLENDIMTMRTIEEQNVAHEIAAECIDLIEDINEKF
jgi:hypothetical protein